MIVEPVVLLEKPFLEKLYNLVGQGAIALFYDVQLPVTFSVFSSLAAAGAKQHSNWTPHSQFVEKKKKNCFVRTLSI